MQAKWDEMFGEKKEEDEVVEEEVKVKKPRMKAVRKKTAIKDKGENKEAKPVSPKVKKAPAKATSKSPRKKKSTESA